MEEKKKVVEEQVEAQAAPQEEGKKVAPRGVGP